MLKHLHKTLYQNAVVEVFEPKISADHLLVLPYLKQQAVAYLMIPHWLQKIVHPSLQI